MKRILLFTALIATTVVSCNKTPISESISVDSGEIILVVDDDKIDMDVTTKASAITAVPSSLYWSCTTGTSTQSSKTTSTSKSVSSGKISTGLYQTASATAYNHYVSNEPIAFAAAGSTISATNDTDVIAGVCKAQTSTSPSVTLNHIFARTGTVSVSATNGYSLSGVSWKIESVSGGTGGTYNIYTDTWSGLTSLGSTTFTSSSDLYLVPGTYRVTVSGTQSLGDYSSAFSKSATITLSAGKVNNISATMSGSGASSITLSVSLSEWGSTTVSAPLS